ncbi:MAG: ABC transporter permease [Candidatus Sulfopaludibacter sp.]|nr:ABC transporter permease [Candidatus Sulfopaludibacter sp.]
MSLWSRMANVFRGERLSREIDREFESHLEEAAAQGRDAAEARRAFGCRLQLREASREIRLWAALDNTWQDARYACRGLRRNPVFAFTAVISLGLAIGANTAIYSIVDAALLRPLPVPQPQRLFTLEVSGDNDTFSYPLYEQLGEAAGDSARLALLDPPNRVEAQDSAAGAPYEEVVRQFVSPNVFDVLGVPPAAGRLLSASEDRYPAPRAVVVLSHDYWRRRYGADPGVVGHRLSVGGRAYSILGVAREGFTGVEPGKFVDVWLPITLGCGSHPGQIEMNIPE